jgi:hypothetical protein
LWYSHTYKPGDTWELYVGKDNCVEYFVYHRGGAKKPSLVFATCGGQSDGLGLVDESAIN